MLPEQLAQFPSLGVCGKSGHESRGPTGPRGEHGRETRSARPAVNRNLVDGDNWRFGRNSLDDACQLAV